MTSCQLCHKNEPYPGFLVCRLCMRLSYGPSSRPLKDLKPAPYDPFTREEAQRVISEMRIAYPTLAEWMDKNKPDGDIHTQTAAAIFNVPVDQVTDAQRLQAKRVNFQRLYEQPVTPPAGSGQS